MAKNEINLNKIMCPHIIWGRKYVDPKYFGSKLFYSQKEFWAPRKLNEKKNWVPKYFGPKNFLDQKHILVKKKLGPIEIEVNKIGVSTILVKNIGSKIKYGLKNLGKKKKLGKKKIFGPKNLHLKKIWGPKKFGSKIFFWILPMYHI